MINKMKLDYNRSLLLIIDMQNDFCPGGALAVKNGDEVIGPLNRLSARFVSCGGRVAATQDWHPAGHLSFASSHKNKKPGDTVDLAYTKNQALWPDHCIQGSYGAELHKGLDQKPIGLLIRKGFRMDIDSYSAFFENDRKTSTGLDGFLKELSINTIVLGGLALDYCVFYSAMDARSLGYNTIMVTDAVRGVDYPEGSVGEALQSLGKAGVIITESGDIQ